MKQRSKFVGIGLAGALLIGLGVAVKSIGETSAQQPSSASADLNRTMEPLLPNAKPGECYAKVLTPVQYKTVTEELTVRDASKKYDIVPARHSWAEEKVLSKEASEKIIAVPAVFETRSEKVEIEPARSIWRAGASADSPRAKDSYVAASMALGLPATAQPGQCYAEYLTPAEYRTEEVKVVKKEAYKKHEIVPAKYEWVEEKVMTKEAADKIIGEPAVYETVTEKVLESPATTTWKQGRGLVERVDNTTGDIMCLVEVPAKYKMVTRRTLKSPAATRTVKVPAEYKTVRKQKLVSPAQIKTVDVPAESDVVQKKVRKSEPKVAWRLKGSPGAGEATGRVLCQHEIRAKYTTVTRQVLKTPATTKKVEIPAEYSTMRVLKVSSPARQSVVEIPAQSTQIAKRVKVADGKLEWRRVLCETNMNTNLISEIQRSLQRSGFDPGPIDGLLGNQTLTAVHGFQKSKGLASGGLTWQTLEALGVKLGS